METFREPALSCVGVTKQFGAAPVVAGLDLEVAPGELLALLGPSGCGKTTTLRLIAGFEHLDAGTITINGRLAAAYPPSGRAQHLPPERRRVGMVFQDYALFPHLTVRQNVGFGLGRAARGQVDDALAMVGLADSGDRLPAQLSGGQQQRVALARALAPRPALILLDEPFSNLDSGLRASVREETRRCLALAGAAAVLVTHDQEEALSLADRVAVMLAGRVVQCAAPADLYQQPESRAVASFVGEVHFLPGEATGNRVRCPLGEAALLVPSFGAVEVIIRPEAVRVAAIESDRGVPGTVRDRHFHGPFQKLVVALDAGGVLTARTGPRETRQPGDRVRLFLDGPVHALAADGAPAGAHVSGHARGQATAESPPPRPANRW